MKFLRDSSEEEMVAVFLNAELQSPRFKNRLIKFFKSKKLPFSLITQPDLSSRTENRIRAQALDSSRGFIRRKLLFKGYPGKLKWSLVRASVKEISDFYYINHKEWIELTAGTRRVRDAGKFLVKNKALFNATSRIIFKLNKSISLDPIIVIATSKSSKKRVILEGHTRATAISTLNKRKGFNLLLGVSPRVKNMNYW